MLWFSFKNRCVARPTRFPLVSEIKLLIKKKNEEKKKPLIESSFVKFNPESKNKCFILPIWMVLFLVSVVILESVCETSLLYRLHTRRPIITFIRFEINVSKMAFSISVHEFLHKSQPKHSSCSVHIFKSQTKQQQQNELIVSNRMASERLRTIFDSMYGTNGTNSKNAL